MENEETNTDKTLFDGSADAGTVTPPVVESASNDAAAIQKRLDDKDNFIKQLQGETSQLRKELEGHDKGREELDKLKEQLRGLRDGAVQQPVATQNASLTETDIETLVANALTKQERAATTAQNVKTATNEATRLYGSLEAATTAVNQKANELGLTTQELQGIAQRSPTAFVALLGTPPTSGKHFDTTSSVNLEALSQHTGAIQPGTKAYFDNIRKENRGKYFTPAIQNQIMAATRAGTYFPK